MKNKIFIVLLLITSFSLSTKKAIAEELDYIPYDEWKTTYIGKLDSHVEPVTDDEFAKKWTESKEKDTKGEWYIDDYRVLHMGNKSPDMRPPINDKYDAISLDQEKIVSLKNKHYSGYKFQTIVGLNNVIFQGARSDTTSETFSNTKNLVSIDLREYSGSYITHKTAMFFQSRVQNVIFPDNFPLQYGDQYAFLKREEKDFSIPFYGDISKLKINKKADMDAMFYGLNIVNPVDLSHWGVDYKGDKELVTAKELRELFAYTKFAEGSVIDMNVFDPNTLESAYKLFEGSNYSGPIDMSNKTYRNLKSTGNMFEGVDLTNAKFNNLSLPEVTHAQDMFYRTKSSKDTLDLSSLYLPNVTDIRGIFAGSQFKEIKVKTDNANFRNVVTAHSAFSGTKDLKKTNFFEVSMPKLEIVYGMFASTGLEEINTTNFNSRVVSSMNNFVRDAKELKKLDLSGLQTRSNVKIPAQSWMGGNVNLEEITFSPHLYTFEETYYYPTVTKASSPGYLGLFRSIKSDKTLMPNDFSGFIPFSNDRTYVAVKSIINFQPQSNLVFKQVPITNDVIVEENFEYNIEINDKNSWSLSAKNSTNAFNLYYNGINISNQVNIIEEDTGNKTSRKEIKKMRIEANENTQIGEMSSEITWILSPNIK